MRGGDDTSRVVLDLARGMLAHVDSETAGLWPRAAALLGCRAGDEAVVETPVGVRRLQVLKVA